MKAVIPAAGLGTRFLPYTKAQPKEMLPVLEKPAIQYVVEEAVKSGIRDIFIITGRGKRSIEDHFDRHPELEAYLRKAGKVSLLRDLGRLLKDARIAYVRQGEPLGNGHAVLCAQSAIGDETFAVMLGDDLMVGDPPCTRELVDWGKKLGGSCLAVQRVQRSAVPSYGMVVGEEIHDGVVRIQRIEEKPPPKRVVSNLVTIGRYVLTPGVFRTLRAARPGRGREIWLTEGIRRLMDTEEVYGVEYKGRRFDVGTKEGWLIANLEMAWRNPRYRPLLRRAFALRGRSVDRLNRVRARAAR